MPTIAPHLILEWFNAVTGLNMEWAEFLTAGERVFLLKRRFSQRCGAGPKLDTLPPRLLTEAYPTGGAALTTPAT
ncbi:MAG TPA: aldehyde ferredoxin oxidoreductase C-terminal domain-containing protein [Symbiobacteriaceae bacterium]|nr:aldehyde ferredoxin oxidoreductase C-terminal domain-containing protein [Symbiobacteriaceae bacterium]